MPSAESKADLDREWRGPDSNRRHPGFQPSALPAELPRPITYGNAATIVALPDDSGAYRRSHGGEPFDERVDEVALEEDGVCSRLGDRAVQLRVRIPGERDQAELRVILPQPCNRCDAVDDRHVQVDHDRVGQEVVRKLDRVQPVDGRADWAAISETASSQPSAAR